jgi:D-ribulokinase
MAYVFGTSACTMATSSEPHKVPGVWGPYYSAMVPGTWLSEGGQSAAGEAIAHLIRTHPAGPETRALAEAEGLSLQSYLLRLVERQVDSPSAAARLAGARVIVPDLLGNRAPFADPGATCVVSGLTLAHDREDLVATYVASVLAVGYGLRQIMEVQRTHGVGPDAIILSGGAGESPTVKQLLADASGVPVLSSASPEPVLLGAAMLGAVASDQDLTLLDAMTRMSRIEATFAPSAQMRSFHDARYAAYQKLQEADQIARSVL